MVKKLQKMAEKQAASTARLLDGQLAQTVKDSAQQIWLAGLGAFAKAQGEGGKVFDTLMKEGLSLHRKTQDGASGKLGGMADRMSAMAGQVAGQVGNQANAQWDKLETIFEERTSRALGRLGVPTARDIATLTERVDALAAAVAALGLGAAPAAPKAGARKARTARAAATPVAPAARSAAAPAAPATPAARKRVARAAKTASPASTAAARMPKAAAKQPTRAAQASVATPAAAPAAKRRARAKTGA